MLPNNEILFKGVFNPKVHKDPLTSCFLIKLDFSLSHTAYFDKIIFLPLFVFVDSGFLPFSSTFQITR